MYLLFDGADIYLNVNPLTSSAISILPVSRCVMNTPCCASWHALFPKHSSQSSQGLQGFLYLTDTTQSDKFNAQTITFTSCDPQDYPGELGVASVIQNAISTNVTAMIFYSSTSENCNITGFPSNYQIAYTMTNTTATAQVYDCLLYTSPSPRD